MARVGDTDKKVTSVGTPPILNNYVIPPKTVGRGSEKGGGFSLQSLNNSFAYGAKAGDLISGIPSLFGSNDKYGFSDDEKASQSGIRSALAMIPGYGQLIAAGSGAVDAIGSSTGLNLSSVDQDTANRSGIKGAGLNKFMNMLPGNSMIWGGFSRLSGNNRTESINVSNDVLGMAGYGATVGDLRAAKNLGNSQLFSWQTREANSFINSQKRNNQLLSEINRVNTQRKQSDYYQDLQNQNINRYAGQNYLGMTVGKNGMKLMSIEEAKRIIALKKTSEEDVEKLQNGGNIPGIDSSILPEGALHKNKNHLDEINPDLEDATKKGIPVMAAEGGEISEQVAEIENNEIIFSKTITDQLEQLMKDGSEEAMIEAGKLVAQEIIENTVDNTGQITEVNGDTNSDNK